MSDPSDIIAGGVGGTVLGGVVMALLKWSGSRNVAALDKTLETLAHAVGELRAEVQLLREQKIVLAKDIGALQEANKMLEKRIDGQATYYREQLERLSTAIASKRGNR